MKPAEGDSLIVDFPASQRRPSYTNRSIAAAAAVIVEERTVTFSPNSQGRYIRYPSQSEISRRWYTESDQRRFRHQMIADAVECSSKMADCFTSAPQELAFQDFVGLDHLISRDVEQRYMLLRAARKKHARIVLAEQARQRREHRFSVDDLARVACASSQWARERARKVGILVASIA